MEGRLGRFINRVRNGIHLSPRPTTNSWERYERRIPGFKDRMMRASADFQAGTGFILNPDLTFLRVDASSAQLPTSIEGASGSPSEVEVWNRLGSSPGFNKSMDRGIKDINEGLGITFTKAPGEERAPQPPQE